MHTCASAWNLAGPDSVCPQCVRRAYIRPRTYARRACVRARARARASERASERGPVDRSRAQVYEGGPVPILPSSGPSAVNDYCRETTRRQHCERTHTWLGTETPLYETASS